MSAAVALAIAGVVGIAAAAPNFESGTASADFVFDNPFTGTIEWVKGPNVDALTIGSKDVVEAPNFANPLKTVGNVGVLAVNTNANHWDVKLTTKYGGRLYTDGGLQPDKTPAGCDDFIVACRDTMVPGPGEVLKYVSAIGTPTGDASESWNTGNEVVLDVAVGEAIKAVTGTFFSIGCVGGGSGNCTNSPLPSRVGKTKLLTTAPVSLGGTAAKLSLAGVIEDDVLAGSNSNLLTQTDFLGADLTAVSSAGDLENYGFKGKNNTNQYIYVNVGIHPDNSSFVDADGESKYKETFTFTLYNGY